MKTTLIFGLLIAAVVAFGKDKTPPLPPAAPELAASIRADVAIAQRDFLIAKSDRDAAQAKLDAAQRDYGVKYTTAQEACKKVEGSGFDPNGVVCTAPPAPPAKDGKDKK